MPTGTGERIGSYVLVEPLGFGGQASVWKARSPTGGFCALKLFGAGVDGARARREAETLKALSHPCLIAARSVVVDARGEPLGIELELIEGGSLGTLLGDPRMTREHRFSALAQVLAGAAEIHRAGLVHRDIKLENVVVSERFWSSPADMGTLKIIDFGIAAAVDNPHPLTAPDRVIGTSRYLPPELLDGEAFPSGEHGASRDVFALGVLACEILTASHPTGLPVSAPHDAYAIAYRVAAEGRSPWPPRSLEGRWGKVVARCLSLDPHARPRSAVEAIALLRASRADAATKTHEHPKSARPPKTNPAPRLGEPSAGAQEVSSRAAVSRPKARKRAWAAVFVAAVLLAGGAAALVASPRPAGPCCGGIECAPDAQNTSTLWNLCAVGQAQCKACASGRATVPHGCKDPLPSSERYRLVVAGIATRLTSPKVCLSSGACGAVGDSLGVFDIATLTQRGLDLRVHSASGEIGRVEGKIPGGVLRASALCVGLLFRGPRGGSVDNISFYLRDP